VDIPRSNPGYRRPVLVAVGSLAFLGASLFGARSEPDAEAPPAQTTKRGAAGGVVRLQLLGVNDLHGHLEPSDPVPHGGDRVRLGGAAWLNAHLKRASRGYPGRTIRLHAGDMVGVSPLVSSHAHDEPTVKAMNLMDFDAGTVGNHEFDEGVDELLRVVRGGRRTDAGAFKRDTSGGRANTSDPGFTGASFPYVAANTVDRQGRLVLPPYTIVERAGVRVGVIGVTTESTPDFLLARHAGRLRFRDVSRSVNRFSRVLRRRGVEAIVVLAHSGAFERKGREQPAGEVIEETQEMSGAVDVVIAGHSHSRLNTRVANRSGKGNKLVVQAHCYGTAFNRVVMSVDRTSGHVVRTRAEIPRTWHDEVRPDPATAALVSGYARRTAALARRVIARVRRPLDRKSAAGYAASDLGPALAEGERALARADLAVADRSALRSDIAAGPVTYGEVFEVVPYDHPVVRMRLPGTEVQRVLAYDAGSGPSRGLVASGFDPAGGLDASRSYTVAMSELFADATGLSRGRGGRGFKTVGTEVDALAVGIKRSSKR
jgi:5'-nucleotidase